MTTPSFAQAAERHLDDVYGYLAWFTGDRFAAEDLAGETFERALRLWHRFDPSAARRARGSARWPARSRSTTSAPSAAACGARSSRRCRSVRARVAEGLSPELESGLARLTAGEREVIALRVVLDLDAATAARVLGISATNCTTRLNRALKKLEEAIHVAA